MGVWQVEQQKDWSEPNHFLELQFGPPVDMYLACLYWTAATLREEKLYSVHKLGANA